MTYDDLDRKIKTIHTDHRGIYGVEKIREELVKQGFKHGDKLIRKRLRSMGIVFKHKRKVVRTTDSGHNEPCAENLRNRDFRAPGPNMAYVGDITYVPGSNGWLYIATVIDLYSRKIAGWAVSDCMDVSLVNKALIMARKDVGSTISFIFHSDRGSQYASKSFRGLLNELNGIQSMSRKGDCWDNAVAESVNGIIKREWLDRRYKPPGALPMVELELFDYIECFYNRKRIHGYLNCKTPHEFEVEYFYENRVA